MTAGEVGERGASHLRFSEVVGQEDAKLALILAAVEPHLGGVLLRGDKGSAKTTLARGLASLLAEGAPFVELPLGATEDRVVGAVDVAALLGDRRHAFRKGLLAAAHGGVLYVDEINLLADHLVDSLLDVAVAGINRVERDGISEAHPARFVLVGSMNPEEGELRPQLLDRFGLCVEVHSPTDPATRASIVRRQIGLERDGSISDGADASDRALRERLASTLPAPLTDATVDAAARLSVAVGAEGLRADLSLCRAAAALAGWEGRSETDPEDLRRVAAMVLAHRRRRDPFDPPGMDDRELADALDNALPPPAAPAPAPAPAPREALSDDPSPAPADSLPEGQPPEDQPPGAPDAVAPALPPAPEPSSQDHPLRLVLPAASRTDSAAGRGAAAAGPRGRAIRTVAYERPDQRLAAAATALADAGRVAPDGSPAARVAMADLRAAEAEQRRSCLVILAVDASGSMAARHRLDAARTAAIGLLGDAYRRRDRVALIAFRGEGAEVVLRPTGSVEIARARLQGIPTGGRTPLAAGLRAVTAMVRASRRGGGPEPVAVLITDGRATGDEADPLAAAQAAAAELAATRTRTLVLDAETGPTRLGLAQALARTLGADHVALDEIEGSADGRAVERAIRERLTDSLPRP